MAGTLNVSLSLFAMFFPVPVRQAGILNMNYFFHLLFIVAFSFVSQLQSQEGKVGWGQAWKIESKKSC